MKNKLLCIAVMTMSGGFIVHFGGQQRNHENPDAALSALRQLGATVVKAVLDRDVATLLRYDRPDLRKDDESFLKDKKSGLYCFLFNSSCLPKGQGRSVYEKLSSARDLNIKVIDGGKASVDHVRYAIILFYDRSTISEQTLRSRTFLCREGLDRLVSWSFKFVEGKWEPVTPLFDNETDTLCSPD